VYLPGNILKAMRHHANVQAVDPLRSDAYAWRTDLRLQTKRCGSSELCQLGQPHLSCAYASSLIGGMALLQGFSRHYNAQPHHALPSSDAHLIHCGVHNSSAPLDSHITRRFQARRAHLFGLQHTCLDRDNRSRNWPLHTARWWCASIAHVVG
jgi:hypothetical protein